MNVYSVKHNIKGEPRSVLKNLKNKLLVVVMLTKWWSEDIIQSSHHLET